MNNLKHVAIIMDGNGRWAQSRFKPRIWGHVRGSNIVSNIVEAADDQGIEALTLYAFSTENWSRPAAEVSSLFNLLKKFLLKEWNRILKNQIKFKIIGEIDNLPADTIQLIRELEDSSKNNNGLKLTFAFSYGGRAEIVRAANILKDKKTEITEEDISNAMYRPETGDVDLIIRTGGDKRISNFLLWQSAYAELFFTDTKWPDFSTDEFIKILNSFNNRERRFGSVQPLTQLSETRKMASSNKEDLRNQ